MTLTSWDLPFPDPQSYSALSDYLLTYSPYSTVFGIVSAIVLVLIPPSRRFRTTSLNDAVSFFGLSFLLFLVQRVLVTTDFFRAPFVLISSEISYAWAQAQGWTTSYLRRVLQPLRRHSQ